MKRRPEQGALSPLKSTLTHMIVIFLMTMTPIFIMGLTIYQVGVNKLDGQIRHSLGQQFRFKCTELADQMQLAQEQLRQLAGENGMLRLSGRYETLDGYDLYDQLNRLQERLATIYDANPFVSQIELFLPRLNRHILAIGAEGRQMRPVIRKIDPAALEKYRAVCARAPGCVVAADGELLCVSQQPLSLTIGDEKLPRLLYVIHYDAEKIDRYFAQTLAETRVGYRLTFADGTTLTDSHTEAAFWRALEERASQVGADLSTEKYYAFASDMDDMNLSMLICAERMNVFGELNGFRKILYALLALFLAAIAIYSVRAYRDVHTPLKLLTDGFGRLAGGDMDFQLDYAKNNEFGYLAAHFNQMVWKLRDTVTRMYRQRILMQQAQIKQLQAQINPHFLYNSFYILENMIAMEDCETAALFSRRLAQYFRYVTRDARDRVPLSEELDHVRSYVEIQKIRFGRRLEIEFPENPPGAEAILLPRLTLQPIVENAFVHALEHCARGTLSVRLTETDEGMRVEVENDHFDASAERVEQMQRELEDEDPNREVTGLMNVHRRLKLTQNSGLRFEKVEPDRLRIVLQLKARGEEA